MALNVANLRGRINKPAPRASQKRPGIDVPYVSGIKANVIEARAAAVQTAGIDPEAPLRFVVNGDGNDFAYDVYAADNEYGFDEHVDGEEFAFVIYDEQTNEPELWTREEVEAAYAAADEGEPADEAQADPAGEAPEANTAGAEPQADTAGDDDEDEPAEGEIRTGNDGMTLYDVDGKEYGTLDPDSTKHIHGYPVTSFICRLNTSSWDDARVFARSLVDTNEEYAGAPIALVKIGKGPNVKIIAYLSDRNLNMSGNTGRIQWEESPAKPTYVPEDPPAPAKAKKGNKAKVEAATEAPPAEVEAADPPAEAPPAEVEAADPPAEAAPAEAADPPAEAAPVGGDLAAIIKVLTKMAAAQGLEATVTLKSR